MLGDLPPVTGETSGVSHTFFAGTIEGTQEEPVNMFNAEYVATVIATRNGAESAPVTATIVASYPTEAPVVQVVSSATYPNHNNNDTLTAQITNENSIQSEGFTYQWYMVIDNPDPTANPEENNDTPIEGATEAIYVPIQGGAYYCEVTNMVNGLAKSGTSSPIIVA